MASMWLARWFFKDGCDSSSKENRYKENRYGTKNCKHRSISLITYVCKILLKVINQMISSIMEENIREEQFGFREGRGVVKLWTNNNDRRKVHRKIKIKRNVFIFYRNGNYVCLSELVG